MAGVCLAAVTAEVGRIEMREFPLPHVGRDDGLLRVELAGVCGSDPGIFYGKSDPLGRPWPIIQGHEIVGRVEKVGLDMARKKGIKEGDRVVVEYSFGCGECKQCLTGNYRYCHQNYRIGSYISCKEQPHLFGGFSQYFYLHPRMIIHKVDGISPKVGVLICAVIGNAVRWLRQIGNAPIGDAVVIQGRGQQGLAAVAVAKEAGCRPIIVTGPSAGGGRFELAKRMGADYCINVSEPDAIEQVRDATDGKMAAVVLDTTGRPEAINTSLSLLRPMGRLVVAGIYGTGLVGVDIDTVVKREITVIGVLSHDISSVDPAISLAKSEKYPWEEMVTHVFPLKDAELAIQTVAGKTGDKPIKVCIDPWQ